MKSLTPEQFKTLQTYLILELGKPVIDYTDHARPLITLLLLETGARPIEILSRPLELQSVKGQGNLITIKAAKGSDDRLVPISDLAAYWIEFYNNKPLGNFVGHRWLSVYFNKLTFRLWSKTYNLYALRHTYCFKALGLTDNNVLAVQAAIGHKSYQSTLRYLRDVNAMDARMKVFKAMA